MLTHMPHMLCMYSVLRGVSSLW